MIRFITLISALTFSLFVSAQAVLLPVDEAPRSFSKGTQSSFQVDIPGAALKDIDKDWQKYIASGSKSKVELINGELVLNGAVNANISPAPFTIISKLVEIPGFVRITSWFILSDSMYVSRELNNDQDLATQKFIRDFALEEYRTVVKAELKKEEASLKALEKELDNLIKEEEKAAKKIDENKRAIQRANDNIATGNADIQSIAYKISSQKEMVEKTAADKNANQGAKKTLKELENSKKSLQKGNENEAKSITKMNAEIRDAERSIADSKEKQKLKTADIEKQKQKTKEVSDKLDGIK